MVAKTDVPLVALIPPFRIEIDGCMVTILESMKSVILGETWYHVVCKIKCSEVETKPFTLDVRSTKELKAKLLVEVSKLKMLMMLYGTDFARRVVS